jgi:hypothetical protein
MNLEKGIVPVWIKLLIQRIKLFNSKLLEDLQVLLIRVRSRGTIIFAHMADGAKLTEKEIDKGEEVICMHVKFQERFIMFRSKRQHFQNYSTTDAGEF